MSTIGTETHYLAVVTVRERRYGSWTTVDKYTERNGGFTETYAIAERYNDEDEARENAMRLVDWFNDQVDGYGDATLYQVVEANVEKVKTTTSRMAIAINDPDHGVIKL